MEVILTEDVEKLGRKGEIVKVKGGFFRNFLSPRKKAVSCTAGNMRVYEENKARKAKKAEEEKGTFLELVKKFEKMTLTVKAQAGSDEKLFGSITAQHIAEALEAEGVKVDRKKIEIEEPIKKLGVYHVKIKLHPEVESSVKVKIVEG